MAKQSDIAVSTETKITLTVCGHAFELTEKQAIELRDALIGQFPLPPQLSFPLGNERKTVPVDWPRMPQPYEVDKPPYGRKYNPPEIWCNQPGHKSDVTVSMTAPQGVLTEPPLRPIST